MEKQSGNETEILSPESSPLGTVHTRKSLQERMAERGDAALRRITSNARCKLIIVNGPDSQPGVE